MLLKRKLIVAVDVNSRAAALTLARKLDPDLCALKVGMELFTAAGPNVVGDLGRCGFDIFLDLKFHDIPNTVAGAVRSAAALGPFIINVHALGGQKMMEAAANAVAQIGHERPLVIAVTILTSMKPADMRQVGIDDGGELSDTSYPMVHLAKVAQQSGLDGVVCSGQEVSAIRKAVGKDFVLVTPGIRLPDGNQNDQARIVTPEMAIKDGATHLVVGRPITEALDPIAALRDFNQRIDSVQR